MGFIWVVHINTCGLVLHQKDSGSWNIWHHIAITVDNCLILFDNVCMVSKTPMKKRIALKQKHLLGTNRLAFGYLFLKTHMAFSICDFSVPLFLYHLLLIVLNIFVWNPFACITLVKSPALSRASNLFCKGGGLETKHTALLKPSNFSDVWLNNSESQPHIYFEWSANDTWEEWGGQKDQKVDCAWSGNSKYTFWILENYGHVACIFP